MISLAFLLAPAQAGDGPWTLQPNETNLYVGLDVFQYGTFRDGGGEVVDLGTGLSALSATAVVTRGLIPGVEIELRVPYERVRATAPESEFCVEGPRDDWCEMSSGLGDLVAVAKVRVLDEAALRPVTVSVAGVLRTGEAYSEHRGRLTNLGDGQTDLGAQVSVGRAASLGKGWYQVSMSGGYMYRLAHTTGTKKIPADEVGLDASIALAPLASFSIGPTFSAFTKTGGVNVMEADLSSMNGFASLAASQVKVGGKLGVYGRSGVTLVAGAQYSVWARNNPTDTLAVSIGMGYFIRAPRGKTQHVGDPL